MAEQRIEVFYSYSHKDEELRNELEKHLSVLKWHGIIADWHDRKIDAGMSWNKEIRDHLNQSRIILLLISPDFLASEYCWDTEMKLAMERNKSGQACVIPIILRPVYWHGEALRELQALPKDARPITTWANRDEAFASVAEGISKISTQLLPRSPHVDMALIPAGEFDMGTDETEIPDLVEWAKENYPGQTPKREWFEPETPRHRVFVDEFYLDKHPVTNAHYLQFVEQTGYARPIGFKEIAPRTWEYNFDPLDHQGFKDKDQPVVCVNWYDAMAYAKWAGKRLPTEAEWEKAARGGLVGRRYPWGDDPPDLKRCNFLDRHKDYNLPNTNIPDSHRFTTSAGKYPANGYGLWDMAGNVWEWCMDEYDPNFYGRSRDKNPSNGIEPYFTDTRHIREFLLTMKNPRVMRGGSWHGEPGSLRVARRNSYLPASADNYIGFRCARSSSHGAI